MNLALDICEPVPYSVSLKEHTRSAQSSTFRARQSVASPVEAMRVARNAEMGLLLLQGMLESGPEPKSSALENFERLLQLLPAELPLTDPYVSESGSICFDWDFDSRFQLSLLLKDKNQIAYAAYFSGEKVHGSSHFSGRELPEGLAYAAKRWIRSAKLSR